MQRADIWRGDQLSAANEDSSLPTGFPDLDAVLPGGGWPQATLTEILTPQEGIGALSYRHAGIGTFESEQSVGWPGWRHRIFPMRRQ